MYRNVPPHGSNPGNQNHLKGVSTSAASSKAKSMNNYFDDDDDDEDNNFTNSHLNSKNIGCEDDEVDPLDAFMFGVEQQIKTEASIPKKTSTLPEIISANDQYSDEIIDKDCRHDDSGGSDSDDNDGGSEVNKYDYNSDGEVIPRNPSKEKIEPLPPVDHKSISYRPFKSNFYSAHSDVKSMTEVAISASRCSMEISVTGSNIPAPISDFIQAGFHRDLHQEIVRRGFERPTSIQSQCLPAAMSGRDIIALAKTGSGKSFAFIWPMIMHVVGQPQMAAGDGPIGIILAPTRELATQIHTEALKFAKIYNIRIAAVYGGAGKWEMTKSLQEWPEIVVATPGRFIELLRLKATSLSNCTMLVLDEADRMFEMGFHYQMRSIVNNIRPDRQTLLFSATMKKKVEIFAREILNNPIRIVVGTIGQANSDIKQIVEVVSDSASKWRWLSQNLDEFVADGKVLIFVSTIIETEEIYKELSRYFIQRQLDIQIDSIHGDKDQSERTNIIKKFSKKEGTSVLVATDIASRGLDIKDIRTVINYTLPKNIETYVHRIGRTGRMGIDGVTPGTAYTLLLPTDTSFAVDLVRNLQLSSQSVSPALQKLAERDPKWNQLKYSGGGGASSSCSSGGGVGKNKGQAIGIGFGGADAPKAMTSAQLADSKFSGSQSGRGAHSISGKTSANLSTDVSLNKSFTSANRPTSNIHSSVPTSSTVSARPPGSVSRFSSAPVLSGFVRAGASYTCVNQPPLELITTELITVSQSVSVTNINVEQEHENNNDSDVFKRKKSRWDT